jgi:hypothetical protein
MNMAIDQKRNARGCALIMDARPIGSDSTHRIQVPDLPVLNADQKEPPLPSQLT